MYNLAGHPDWYRLDVQVQYVDADLRNRPANRDLVLGWVSIRPGDVGHRGDHSRLCRSIGIQAGRSRLLPDDAMPRAAAAARVRRRKSPAGLSAAIRANRAAWSRPSHARPVGRFRTVTRHAAHCARKSPTVAIIASDRSMTTSACDEAVKISSTLVSNDNEANSAAHIARVQSTRPVEPSRHNAQACHARPSPLWVAPSSPMYTARYASCSGWTFHSPVSPAALTPSSCAVSMQTTRAVDSGSRPARRSC